MVTSTLCDGPGQSEDMPRWKGRGGKAGGVDACSLHFSLAGMRGSKELRSWLHSQETPGEGLLVLNEIQEQKKSNPVPHQPERRMDENKPVKYRLDTSSVVGLA